jgi:hypothetical protein
VIAARFSMMSFRDYSIVNDEHCANCRVRARLAERLPGLA